MPRRLMNADRERIDGERTRQAVDRVVELSEILSQYMLQMHRDEDWRTSPHIEALAQTAALLTANGREIPLPVRDALKRAAEAGRPFGLA